MEYPIQIETMADAIAYHVFRGRTNEDVAIDNRKTRTITAENCTIMIPEALDHIQINGTSTPYQEEVILIWVNRINNYVDEVRYMESRNKSDHSGLTKWYRNRIARQSGAML